MPTDAEMEMLPSNSRRRERKTLKKRSLEIARVIFCVLILLVISWFLRKPVLWVNKMMNETSQSDVDKELVTISPATVAPIDPKPSVTANAVPATSSEPATTPPTSPVVVLTIPPITTQFIPPALVITTPQPSITRKRKNLWWKFTSIANKYVFNKN